MRTPTLTSDLRGQIEGLRGQDGGWRGLDGGLRGQDGGWRGQNRGLRGHRRGEREQSSGLRGQDGGWRGGLGGAGRSVCRFTGTKRAPRGPGVMSGSRRRPAWPEDPQSPGQGTRRSRSPLAVPWTRTRAPRLVNLEADVQPDEDGGVDLLQIGRLVLDAYGPVLVGLGEEVELEPLEPIPIHSLGDLA